MKIVILAGGKGTRYNQYKSKALAIIGDKPIIHHILEIYSMQEFNDFILALGYMKDDIINYFNSINHNYNIEFVDTGEDTNTGGRIKKIESYIKTQNFFCTYGDGLANINLHKLYNCHIKSHNIATITAVRPYNQFGVLTINDNDQITDFIEKPKLKEWVNGGFFVFNKKIFNYIDENKNQGLETDILTLLANKKLLKAYRHENFWMTLNTLKDEIELNNIFKKCTKENKEPIWLRI